MSEGQIGGYH